MKAYKKLLMSLLLTATMCLFFASCEEDDNIPKRPDLNWEKEILTLSIPSLELEAVRREGSDIFELLVDVEYDLNTLKNVVPAITISEKATISPISGEAKDFSRLVEYTVTAEDGSIKNWVILAVHSKEVGDGIGSFKKSWFKTITDLEIGAYENAIGILGDKLVLSRTGKIFDAKTGAKTGEILNMSGIYSNSDNNKIPYILTNDNAGNLLGCTLGAWTKPYFKVYKWTALDEAPVEILSFTADTVETNGTGGKDIGQFGRKMSVVGDVLGNAYISSYNYATASWGANTMHWKVEGGIVNQTPVKTTSWYNTKSIYQMACVTNPENLANYYFSDMGTSTGSSPTTLKLRSTANKETTLKGMIDGVPGWGSYIIDIKLFTFNNHKYLAVLHRSATKYYISVLDVQDEPEPNGVAETETRVVYQASVENVNENVNGTAGLTVGKEENGTMYIYGLFSNNGIMCCEITNMLD